MEKLGKIKLLKEIKPEGAWVSSNKRELFKDEESFGFSTVIDSKVAYPVLALCTFLFAIVLFGNVPEADVHQMDLTMKEEMEVDSLEEVRERQIAALDIYELEEVNREDILRNIEYLNKDLEELEERLLRVLASR